MATSPTVLLRQLRPLAIKVGVTIYICYRLSDPTGTSLLETLVTIFEQMHQNALQKILLYRWAFLLPVMNAISTITQDVVAMTGVAGLLRFGYFLCHFRLSDRKDLLLLNLFHWITPFFNKRLQKIANKILTEADSMLAKEPNRIIRLSLPEKGLSDDIILNELSSCANRENTRCQTGKISGTLYSVGHKHSELMGKVYNLYQWSNPLKPGVWPRVNQCEAEIVAMTARILNGKPFGCVTSGGTESILTAVRAHVELYGKQRGITCPEIICSSTAHCSLDKACEILNVRLVRINCDSDNSYELKAATVQKHITCNTIMIFASAPSFPTGLIDPIDELSTLTKKYDLGLHVDACLGGFILPFCGGDIAPRAFDFLLPGVTSMSADTHKYGHATKGTSVVLFKSSDLQHASYFAFPRWSGGLYITPTVAGSRPGGLIACAWAALVSIGESGYQQRARVIVEAARSIADAIKSIDGLKLMTSNPTIVVCFTSDVFNIYRLKDTMSKMGWSLNPLQQPAALNICVTENLDVDEFLQDLIAAVVEVKASVSEQKKADTEMIYNTIGMLPPAAVEFAMHRFTDASLAP
jgi:sphinganine-1-phosphate aldolase